MASISGNNKIVIKAGYTQGAAEHEEGPLQGAATPGMNLVMTAADEVLGRHTYKADSTDYVGTGTSITTAKGPIKVLKENAMFGGTIDTAYASGDNAFIHIAKPGDVLQVLVASGQTVLKTSGLTAGSDGKWVVDTTNAVVEALEDSNGALGADTHVRVRVL